MKNVVDNSLIYSRIFDLTCLFIQGDIAYSEFLSDTLKLHDEMHDVPEKCDGNHAGPRCTDPECWNDSEPSNAPGTTAEPRPSAKYVEECREILKAWLDGNPIESRFYDDPVRDWSDDYYPVWNFADKEYRVKVEPVPEPKPREFWIELALSGVGYVHKIDPRPYVISDAEVIHVREADDR
jgi:hypothetical protein